MTGSYRYEGLTFGLPVLQCGCEGENPPNEPFPTPTEGPVSNTPPSISATACAVIFEDRYENSLGQWVDKRSTKVTITVSVDGGAYGGKLTLSMEKFDRLAKSSGHSLPMEPVSIPAGYTMAWVGEYEGKYASDTTEDILIVATFTSNNPMVSSMSDALNLTSVRVETQTMLEGPEPRSRKSIGVAEAVDFIITPSTIPGLSLTADDGELKQHSLRFIAGEIEKTCVVQVNAYDVYFPEQFSVVSPHGFLVLNLSGQVNGEPTSTSAGHFIADMLLAVMPTNVSFQNLRFMEKGMPSTDVVGYFTNSWCSSWVTHVGNGADKWYELENGNLCGDRVGMPPLPLPWGDGGSFSWPIPNLWRVLNSSNTHEIPHVLSFDQRFQLDADGTSRVLKHDCRIQRKRGDLYEDPDAFILEGGIE